MRNLHLPNYGRVMQALGTWLARFCSFRSFSPWPNADLYRKGNGRLATRKEPENHTREANVPFSSLSILGWNAFEIDSEGIYSEYDLEQNHYA